jgi:ArsR family transcriptional regulator
MLSKEIQSDRNRKAILNSFKAISDETRIRIINILSFGAFNVNEITEILEMGQSRVSRHLKILTDANLLKSEREGTWVYYSLQDRLDFSFYKELNEFILSYKEDLPFREEDQKKVSQVLKSRDDKSSNYFNKIGKNWERIQQEVLNPVLYRNQIDSFLPDKLNTILDLGCGPGGLFPYLLKKSKTVIGVDSSQKMLEAAKLNYAKNKNVKLFEAPLENLPFKEASADAVVASMVLHHISNPPLMLQEVWRVLKNKGVLCLVDLKKHSNEFMRDQFADLWLGFDMELLANWLSSAGFILDQTSEMKADSFSILTIKAIKKGGQNVRSSN